MSNLEDYPAWYKPKFYAHIPKTLYEKYVEAWYFFSSGKGLLKKRAQELANIDWEKSSTDEKNELVKKHLGRIRKRQASNLFSFGFKKKSVSDTTSGSASINVNDADTSVDQLCSTIQSTETSDKDVRVLVTENASGAPLNKEKYVSSQSRSIIDMFLGSLGDECRKFIDDPHVGDTKVLMDSLLSVAFVYNDIKTMLEEYESTKIKRRKSELSAALSEFYEKRNELKRLIIEAMQVNITPKLGLLELRTNADRKDQLIKDITVNSLQLKSFIDAKNLKRSLNRRLQQIRKVNAKNSPHIANSDKETVMVCFNNSNLSWHEAFANLTGSVNNYNMDVYNIGMLMKDSAAVSVKEHLSHIKPTHKETMKFVELLLVNFPLMFMKKKNGEEILINLHQTSNSLSTISELLDTDTDVNVSKPQGTSVVYNDDIEADTTTGGDSQPETIKSKKGRQSIVDKFPMIPIVATEFIKRNGFKAQEKRRDDDFVSCGVSVDEVKQHLLKTIPGLADFGLSRNTVRYLFKPVHRSRNSSKRYKGCVDCNVPKKDNSLRPSDGNSHYLHSRINMRLEQAFMFEDEHIVFSADAMNKINVGNVLCVSRYHQIRRLFMVEDKVKYNDHDFPQGYKIIPCGKMPLLKPGVFLQDVFGGAVNDETGDQDVSDIYEHDNIEEDTGYDTNGCLTDETNQAPVEDGSIPQNTAAEFRNDKLGRAHVKFPRTGPVLVYNRNGQFHSQTMESHANDFLPLLTNAVKGGRSCIVCVVDNGPDMNPTNYVNEFSLGNLWKDSGADMLVVTSFAAGQSAYNMIEHAWSPLSNKLTSVMLPAVLPGEDKPPNKQSTLTNEERAAKEKKMLDTAANILAQHWNSCTFDGHPVVPITVPCDEEKSYDEHDEILRFICSPIRNFKTDKKLQQLRKVFRFYAKHAVRRENEFVLMKCQFFRQPGLECSHCQTNPPTALHTLNFMKRNKGKFVQPSKSEVHPGHYKTFLEMINCTDLPEEESQKELGKCLICPNWSFSSVTEQDRHRKLLHPDSRVKDVVPEESQIHRCTWKINSVECGEKFKSHHILWKHKTNLGHKRNRSEIAKTQQAMEKEKTKKQQKGKEVAKKISKQRFVTNWINAQADEDEDSDRQTDIDEGRENEESAQMNNDFGANDDDSDEIDDDDCNAKPCKIDDIVSKSRDQVDWIQCRLCPKWYHSYCVNVKEEVAHLFECYRH